MSTPNGKHKYLLNLTNHCILNELNIYLYDCIAQTIWLRRCTTSAWEKFVLCEVLNFELVFCQCPHVLSHFRSPVVYFIHAYDYAG